MPDPLVLVAPRRQVFQAEALAWLAANPAGPGASVVTSLPDLSEIPGAGFEAWRAWFLDAARRVLEWVPAEGVAIFFQSDVRHRGAWIDKGYLVQRAAEDLGALLLWHKIVCREPAGTPTFGRASYSHLVCVSRSLHVARRPAPDVLPDAGLMTWSRAMGLEACLAACRYLRDDTPTRVVVDPFCGRGSVLAAANLVGLDAVGVDLSARRCRHARGFTIPG